MKTSRQIICASCSDRIRESEPDLVPRKLGSPELHFFHTRCGDAARCVVLEDPGVWHMTVRHVHEEAN